MRPLISFVVGAAGMLLATPGFAQFAPAPNPVSTPVTGQRTLSGGTGTVTSTGSITLSNGNATVVMSGTGTILDNAGTIQQTGTGRAIDNTANNSSLTIDNTGVISAVSTDALRINTANTSISLTNSGSISVSAGGQAVDWAGITTASNSLNNLATGTISAVGEDAVRPGQNGMVTNAGSITATPVVTAGAASGSDGIDLRTEKTVTVTNSGSISGRAGIATDGANVGPSSLTVNNNAGGLIAGVNGSGINVDANTSLPSATTVTANVTNAVGATIRGGVLATTTTADGDGVDVDGILTLNNSGDVLGLGAKGSGNNAEAVSIGGGSITNTSTGRIVGSSLAADAPNGDPTHAGNGILADDSNDGNAVAATTISNSGLIQGKTGFAIKMIGTFANSITNEPGGVIQGAGTDAAIQTGAGADTLINRGSIVSDIGNAIDLQGGNDSLKIEGGAASIVGNVSGGAGTNTLTLAPGAGNSFAYSGSLSNFDSVEVQSGRVTLSGANTYTGTTRVTGGILELDGANRIASGSALDLSGGTLRIANAGGANGQTFASLSLTGSSVIDLDFDTTLTFDALGAIVSGESLSVEDYDIVDFADYAFRLLGDYSTNSDFLTLIGETTINGHTPGFEFDGQFTDVFQVPEPASLALFGTSVLAFAALRRRRFKIA